MAFDEPAVREAVGDVGVLVPINDGTALATAIAALLADKAESAERARQGRKRFEERFTDDRYIASMVALYAEVGDEITRRYRPALRWFRGGRAGART